MYYVNMKRQFSLTEYKMKYVPKVLKRLYTSRTSTNKKVESSAEYCLQSVKRYDYENFLCTLLLSNPGRSCAFAVRGFNVEVARVAEQVSDSKLGLMRFKFWEDTIDCCFSKDASKVPQHPVAIELFKAINRSKLTKRHFMSLIISRQTQLISNTFSDLEAIEKYAEQSVCAIYYLILEGCGITNVNADHAASHLGKAQSLVQQLRSVNVARNLNIMPFPQNILTKHNVSHEEVLRGKTSERLCECSFELASRAYQHLAKARSLLKDVPIAARNVLLPAIAVDNYLNRLQNINHDVLHPNMKKRSFTWVPKLWLAKFRQKY